jgi:ligand-binding sensor domain-containing protein
MSFNPGKSKAVYFPGGPMLVVFALLFCGAMPLCAQPGYRFDQWTTSNGLPQNSVVKIAQTRDGYLWLATHDGLARFDGVRFTVFDWGNTPALKSNRI